MFKRKHLFQLDFGIPFFLVYSSIALASSFKFEITMDSSSLSINITKFYFWHLILQLSNPHTQ